MTTRALPRHRCSPYRIDYGPPLTTCLDCDRTWRFDARLGWDLVKFGRVA